MNYGLYIAASGAATNLARQDVASNNLANVSTTGFKPLSMAMQARDPVRVEDGLSFMDSDRLLERLGAGVTPSPTRVKQKQGPIETTGRSLDLAIDGGGFLVTRVGGGPEGLRFTRDGRLQIDAGGRLVRANDGAPVLGAEGGTITVDASAPLHVRADGALEQNGGTVGRLWVADVADRDALVAEGSGLYRVADGEGGANFVRAGSGRLVQGALEGSGVDPIKAIMDVTGAGRSVQGNIRMISIIGQNLEAAINRFGRVG